MSRQTLVIRIEIATITGPDGKLNRKKMDKLAMLLTNLNNSGKQVLMVSSGAIVLGTQKLKLQQLPLNQLDMQAVAAVGQAELIRAYQQSFDVYNQTLAQVLLTSDIIHYPRRVENTRNTLLSLLEMGVIPVINENDAVSTADIEFDDNYYLALMVANIVRADFIVIKTDVNGNYLIVPRGQELAFLAPDETQLQHELDSCSEVILPNAESPGADFPASISDILFRSTHS